MLPSRTCTRPARVVTSEARSKPARLSRRSWKCSSSVCPPVQKLSISPCRYWQRSWTASSRQEIKYGGVHRRLAGGGPSTRQGHLCHGRGERHCSLQRRWLHLRDGGHLSPSGTLAWNQ